MTWNINCKEATRLVLQRLDVALPWPDRLKLRMHLFICAACPRFVRQAALMQSAMGRWRSYRDDSGDAPLG